ncbi:MAG: HAD hydrolase-like protein [Pseudomonadota bacterium]
MRYDLVIFDLDGTLADTFPFFIAVQNRVARLHGFAAIGPHEVDAMRRLGPREVMRHVGMPRWKLPFVVRSFTRLMRRHRGPMPLFDGVGDALAHLETRGVALAVVTSNSRDNLDRLLGPGHCVRMRHVECGASMFGKHRRLRRVARAAGVPASRAIYIGDQIPDAEAARAAGMDFGAVTWGYGARESLQALAPAIVFETPHELRRLGGE